MFFIVEEVKQTAFVFFFTAYCESIPALFCFKTTNLFKTQV